MWRLSGLGASVHKLTAAAVSRLPGNELEKT